MEESLLSFLESYTIQVVTVVVGAIIRWWEKREIEKRHKKQIEGLIEDVSSAKYGSRN